MTELDADHDSPGEAIAVTSRVDLTARVDGVFEPNPNPSSGNVEQESWSVAQAAAVAAAEAIAATAAADVAAEAAVTARAAVEVASAAAVRAATKASEVAARAALAAAASAVESLARTDLWKSSPDGSRRYGTAAPTARVVGAAPVTATASDETVHAAAVAAAGAVAKVAVSVAAVATAAAQAAMDAAALIGEQLASDVAATATAVTAAAAVTADPALAQDTAQMAEVYPSTKVTGPLDHVPSTLGLLTDLQLAGELSSAVSDGELRLHYQPIISLVTGQPVGVEALVRWKHPVRGLLYPDSFIELAERADLIGPLGTWVLGEACRFAVALPPLNDQQLTVAVNLSGRQMSDPGLVASVRAALAEHGCRADQLVFEVTETALVTDMATAVASMREVQALGAGVALDDFGTGYSSMLYLKSLGAGQLKIDRSFINGLGADPYDTAMVASLISLAHNLNVRCIAEGVETTEQRDLLRQLGCDLAQGYLFSRPVEEQDLLRWLDRQDPTPRADRQPILPVSPETPRILAMHQNNISLNTIAASLNSTGSRTTRGCQWSARSVAHALTRAHP